MGRRQSHHRHSDCGESIRRHYQPVGTNEPRDVTGRDRPHSSQRRRPIRRFRSTYTSRSVHSTPSGGFGGIVAIEEVVARQVFTGRRTSLRAGSAHKSCRCEDGVRRQKTVVTGPEPARGSDMPSKLLATPVFDVVRTDPGQVFWTARHPSIAWQNPGCSGVANSFKDCRLRVLGHPPPACYRGMRTPRRPCAQVAANQPPPRLGGASRPARQ